MDLKDVRRGLEIVITAGGEDHPLHGHRGTVRHFRPSLPDPPPADWPEGELWQVFRADDWEQPFAWPEGQVLINLGSPETGRRWGFPAIWVSPADIEPATEASHDD